MARQVYGSLFVIAIAAALGGCAADAPVNPNAATPTAARPPAATPATEKAVNNGSGYRLVTRGGVQTYCKQVKMTGSLTKERETCLTPAEMAARTQGGQELAQ
jgi:hypothetical protein